MKAGISTAPTSIREETGLFGYRDDSVSEPDMLFGSGKLIRVSCDAKALKQR
jgi:hypothetical protein